jgi:surface carbohydrate biosynthesis protein
MKYRNLIIPIETKNRELYSKILLSSIAVQEGWMVFLGHKEQIHKFITDILPGVHIEISIPEHKYEKYLLPYTRMGHQVVNICEESVIYSDAEDYCDRKVGLQSLKLTEKFFAAGQRHAKHVTTYRDVRPGQLAICGNHRFDILRQGYREVYSSKTDEIKNRLGLFILVNTNFARCNPHPSYGDRLAALKNKKIISNSKQLEIWQDLLDYKSKLMAHFMDYLPEIPALFDSKVVIRPHPSENHQTWERWARNHKDIFVFHEGSANEWMIAAGATIHNGCTTGLEGFMLERPVIAYVPEPDSDYSKNIANEVSYQVDDKTKLLAAVEKALKTGTLDTEDGRKAKVERLRYFIENVGGPLASECIVEELGTLNVPFHSLDSIMNRTKRNYYGSDLCILRIRHYLRKKMAWIKGNKKNNFNRMLQKFPGLSESEVLEPLRVWNEQGLLSSMPKVTKIADNLFCFFKE